MKEVYRQQLRRFAEPSIVSHPPPARLSSHHGRTSAPVVQPIDPVVDQVAHRIQRVFGRTQPVWPVTHDPSRQLVHQLFPTEPWRQPPFESPQRLALATGLLERHLWGAMYGCVCRLN